jgi:phenylalanyl-tRNA synthetase beta chain
MRVPVSWLAEYVPIEMPLPELASRLSVASAEIEGIEALGLDLAPGGEELLKVGRVLAVGPHPNADRVRLVRVDVGEAEPRSIVCGAFNFEAGATVAVALPGAVLANGVRLERRKVRGELSDGMILAEDELGLGSDHSGIILLPSAAPGSPLSELLPLSEAVLVVEATGNRPDLQSVYGLAREVAALFELPLAPLPGSEPVARLVERQLPIAIEDLVGCPRYVGRLFEGIVVGPSPQWLRTRLQAAGVRPISNVVDVTNYVMLALGSPLHAFDFATLREGRIVVRRASNGEALTTLDGVRRELNGADLVIADGERAVALAGIMGGEETEITGTTTSVLLEAANFDPTSIFATSERQRLRTEASGRWEKGVDAQLAGPAAELATALLLELAAGALVAAADVHAALPEPPVVRFRPARADALIGVETPPERQYALLEALGFARRGDELVTPSWRARDVTREIDVIEEIARFRLDEVPFTLPARREMFGTLSRAQLLRRRLEDALVGLGFAELYSPSLRPDGETRWRLPDPISAELAVLRTSLLPSLVEAASRNLDQGARGIALFEIARVYLSGDELPEERVRIAGISEGGFLHIKGVVEVLHAALKAQPSFVRSSHELLHPGRTAETEAGVLGELRPGTLPGDWSAFELDLTRLFELVDEPLTYVDVITYPAIREDIALVVEESVPVGELLALARTAAGAELREARVFDVFRGEQVGPGRKSVALALSFQSAEGTLTEADAARLRERIVSAAKASFDASLRGAAADSGGGALPPAAPGS